MSTGILVVTLVILLMIGNFVWLTSLSRSSEAAGTEDSMIKIELGDSLSVEIISNEELATRQKLQKEGGLLAPSDLVVVWARHFLDHDVLYEEVVRNIHGGVRYLYVLDNRHRESMAELLRRLWSDTQEPGVVEEKVDVVFVQPTLTLNNYVMLAEGTSRQSLYAGLIYDYRPYAWVEQDAFRVQVFHHHVARLLMCLGVRQFKALQAGEAQEDERGLFERESDQLAPLDSQIMDFSDLGRRVLGAELDRIEDFSVDLKAEIGRTVLPRQDERKIRSLRQGNEIVSIARYRDGLG